MEKKPNSLFRRGLAMLLCIVMLLSYVVLPVSADEEQTATAPAPSLKFTLPATNVNYYAPNQTVLIHTNWLKTLAEDNTVLRKFLNEQMAQYVDIMPAEGKTQWDTNVLATNAIPTFNPDGTVKITNNAVYTGNHYWPYVSTTPKIEIDLDLTPYLYFSYSGNAEFNLAFYYNGITGTNVSVGSEYLGSDFPEGTHTYCIDLKACTGLSGKITLDKCLFYAIGGTNDYVTLSNIGFSSRNITDETTIRKDGIYMDNYYAVVVEYMGTPKVDMSGVEGVEYFVDAVIDCAKLFDENPHQLMAKTQYGFVMYIPKTGGFSVPERGDLVDATFKYSNLRENNVSLGGLGHSLSFYENPTEQFTYATATDVNATVKLFNYDATVNNEDNGFNFWNGYWGFGGNVESEDGAGVEDGLHKNPFMSSSLVNGYPQLSDGTSLDYLFNGEYGFVNTMTNGGGLFQMDQDGYYYYDSLKNAAYYDSEQGKFVLYDDLIVRPWYHANAGDDYKDGTNFQDFADAFGAATTYGNFLPFNKLDTTNITVDGAVYDKDHNIVLENKVPGSLEKYDLDFAAANKVLAGNKAMNDTAYASIDSGITSARLEDKVNMGFGMTVDFDFYMPQGGKVNGEEMVFDFLGDDDVFVYIGVWNDDTKAYDYKLVLDIGGSHEAREGKINFATGEVIDYPANDTQARSGTLQDIFGLEGDSFADFTKLSLKFFYLERGGNISYCRLRFNMPTLPENSLTVGKALDMDALGSQTYQFRVLDANDPSNLFIPANTQYTITGTNTTGTTDENGYFELKPGQSVTFNKVMDLSQGKSQYIVEETITQEVDSQFTITSPVWTVNGSTPKEAAGGKTAEGVYVYRTEAMTLDTSVSQGQTRSEKAQIVGFTNIVDEAKLGKLSITKQIKEGAKISPDASFNMRVTLGGALLPVGTSYTLIKADGSTETKTVTTKGIVTLMKDQTVVIERILSTSTFEVVEVAYNVSPSYSSENSGVTCSNSGASGVMPLEGDISILVVNDDSSGLIVDKTVDEVEGTTDEFMLTLEAFATGKTSSFTSTTPADIVLVLDQSASMYTPKGATADRYDRWTSQSGNAALTKIDPSGLDTAKGTRLGYYVAQSATMNREVSAGAIYDWFVVQYIDGKWYYARVGDTTTSVKIDTSNAQPYVHGSGDQYNTAGDYTIVSDSPLTELNYYESQYAALYESVTAFVDNLKNTGVDHRIAITGFSSPYYDGIAHYNGSGLYVDGQYYLYDTDYKYKGVKTSSGIYLLYAPQGSDVYTSMKGILPDSKKGSVWTDTLPAGMTEADLVPLDVTDVFRGDYFAETIDVINPLMSQEEYRAMTVADQYGNALASVQSGYDSLKNSIEAVRTNYQQTCPAVGLEMAKNIFDKSQPTTDENGNVVERDQIVILFTDGVPTVGLYSDNEDSTSRDAKAKETYWSGLAGAVHAVEKSNVLKDSDVQVYTIGTSGLAADVPHAYNVAFGTNAAQKSIDGETFLGYVSSNYRNITGVHEVEKTGYDTDTEQDDKDGELAVSTLTFYYNGEEITTDNPVKPVAQTYAKTSKEGGISVAFDHIMQSVSSPNVALGKEAVLREVLSDYFDLTNADQTQINVYVAPCIGMTGTGEYEFGEKVLAADEGFEIGVKFEDTTDREDVIVNVDGFSYSEHYVRQDPTTKAYMGYKIIVEVPIKARDGFWGGNNVPTNKDTTAIYDGEDEVQDFPMPEANVPVVPVITTKNQVVYYADGTIKAEHVFDKVTVDGKLVVYDAEKGTFVPGLLNDESDDWMDDYATLNWSNGSSTLDTAISSTTENDYTFGVTLAPLEDHTGEDNMSVNGSNIAGNPVDMGGSSVSSTGHVDVLVPVLTFKDSTIDLGDETSKTYYDETNYVEGIKWVDMSNAYDAEGNAIEAKPTMGTEPELTLTYTPEGTGNNYFKEDTAVDVTVKIGTTDLTTESYFEWVDCKSDLHDEEKIANHKGSVAEKEFWIHVNPITMDEDTVVIDFGLPVDIDVLYNDALYSHGTLAGVMFGERPSEVYTDTLGDAYVTELDPSNSHGKVIITDGDEIRYTPNDMEMPTSEKFVYAVKYENGSALRYYYSTVTVIPATTIYFEDNFVDFTVVDLNGELLENESWTKVESEGDFADRTQAEDRPGTSNLPQIDANNIYGYDAAYADMDMYSLGSAMMVNVNADKTGRAEFTFWGTGFDVISLTSNTTGTILVMVYELDKDGNPKDSDPDSPNDVDPHVAYMVDTYYGYQFVDGEWVAAPSVENALYQVPVIKSEGLPYGRYKVIISASYSWLFDHGQNSGNGSYDFYLDAIRIYDPANDGVDNSIIEDAYKADGEGWPTYYELRNMLIGANTFDSLGANDEADGIIFIDGNSTLKDDSASNVPGDVMDDTSEKSPAIKDYANYGPNNELYLAPDQAVAFQLNMTAENNRAVKAVHLAMKSVGGGTASVMVYSPADGNAPEPMTVSTATDLYYDISNLNGKTVIIYNTADSDVVLSVTNIKVTYTDETGSADDASVFTISKSMAYQVVTSLMALQQDAEPQPIPTITPKYPTVSFEDEIQYNVFFEIANLGDIPLSDIGMITFDSKLENGTMDDAVDVIPGATYYSANGLYMIRSNGIPAKNMGDMLYFKMYIKLADGTYAYSDVLEYNAIRYANATLAGNNEELKALVVAMLNYGAAAQMMFNYNTDELMNAGLTAEQQALAAGYSYDMIKDRVAVSSSKSVNFPGNVDAFDQMYPTVSFEGAFAINYFFEPKYDMDGDMTLYYWDLETYNSVDVLTVDNASGSVVMTDADGDGQYWGDYAGIAAKEIGDSVFAVGVYESNGQTYSTGVISYSLATYCKSLAEDGSLDMQSLAKATAVYGHCAKEYFN